MSSFASSWFPAPQLQDQLKTAYVGKTLHDVALPSAVLDVSKVRQSCQLMLDAVAELQLSFRAHVKTHKTSEMTRLQVGAHSKDVRLVVSTVAEAESLLPLLQAYQHAGAKVNVLYGVPLGPCHVSRLAVLARTLGPGSIAAMVDSPDQLESVRQFRREAGEAMAVFIKVDSGQHRAGLLPASSRMVELLQRTAQCEQEHDLLLLGLYSHNSLSYHGNSPEDAMQMLQLEIDSCRQACKYLPSSTRKTPLIITVGASPTVLALQNIQSTSSDATATSTTATALRQTLQAIRSDFELEVHAGVYPILDLQQVAASARAFASPAAAHAPLALTILTEVISTYPDRTSQPEALVAAGCLALAREPCKSYPGWGVVSAWNMASAYEASDERQRIMVSRISQEHGILGWQDGDKKDELPLAYGQRLRIWPNHACITSAGYAWYLVVDSSLGPGREDEVVDVWLKWRGW